MKGYYLALLIAQAFAEGEPSPFTKRSVTLNIPGQIPPHTKKKRRKRNQFIKRKSLKKTNKQLQP